MFNIRNFATLFCVLPLTSLSAHEFWLAPEAYQVAPGDSIRASFVNGQNFKGVTLAYFDRGAPRFETISNGVTTPVTPRAGDNPALDITAPDKAGLLVVLHETAPATLTYREWEKFQKFVAHKAFETAEAEHIAAGWPQTGFKERYSRHVKALIAVGDGAGQDANQDMVTEFVALSNPYEKDFDGNMTVQLFYQGSPRTDAQVEVFDKPPAGDVAVTLYRTDTEGKVTVPVEAGHEYLFDAVVLRAARDADPAATTPLWESFWAGLTFAVPQ